MSTADDAMDVAQDLRSSTRSRDEENGRQNIYAKSDEVEAAFYSFLPIDLQALRNTGMNSLLRHLMIVSTIPTLRLFP